MVPEDGCKVDRVSAAYDLDAVQSGFDTIDEALRARWRGDDGFAATGYRPLTAWFNKRLMRSVYGANGRETLGGRVENDYEALTGDDDLLRDEVGESLATDGIDASALRSDMVSWGTMRTHLTECLDAEKPTGESGSDWERDSIEMARSFARRKVEGALSSLASSGELVDGERGSVSVQFQCRCGVDDCPTRVPMTVALDRGYVCETHASDPAEE